MNQEDQVKVVAPDELALLKRRADTLGVVYHPSIGVEKLREKVNAALQDVVQVDEPVVMDVAAKETQAQLHSRIRRESTELIRVRLTCMNPAKQAWPGEIFTVSNSVMGTIKKFIPFNAEDGWHIPRAILNVMQERVYQAPYTENGPRGQKIRKYKLAKEFAIEILPNLTPAELKDLANQQAIAKRLG